MNCRGKVLPEDFISLMRESLDERECASLFSSFENGEDVVSVRINPLKSIFSPGSSPEKFALKIFGENLDAPVKWCPSGFYLKKKISFTADPYFHCGAYYVQDASSMFPEIIKKYLTANSSESASADGKLSGLKLLDLCAAPGGKSTHLASMLDDSSLLVSNEAIKKRVLPLMDNMAKWGRSNVVVTSNYSDSFGKLANYFDVIFADVPCSGEGMFRKSDDAIDGWSIRAVKECAERQRKIVSDVWPALKAGGIFVYSTCTYNHLEDSDNVRFICDNLDAEVLDSAKFVPGIARGEGQFYAVLRKNSAGAGDKRYKTPVGIKKENNCNWLGDKYIYVQRADGMVKAYPKLLCDDIMFLEKSLNVEASGVAIAIAKGKDFVPYADLALNNDFKSFESLRQESSCNNLFPVHELTKEEALQFLTKRPLVLSQMPNGYIFLTYNGLGLGFVKNLGNRTNNLLPAGRAIHNLNLVDF
jgi:16S rRNA (cytosine1407-C5)-methyltransferase